jgi:hypothetical protein
LGIGDPAQSGSGAGHLDELSSLAQILCGGCEEELLFCTVATPQAQAVGLQDAFEVREQLLDLLPLGAQGLGGGGVAGKVGGAFVDRTQDLTVQALGTAPWPQIAGVAYRLTGAIFVRSLSGGPRNVAGLAASRGRKPRAFAAAGTFSMRPRTRLAVSGLVIQIGWSTASRSSV